MAVCEHNTNKKTKSAEREGGVLIFFIFVGVGAVCL